MLPKLTKLMEKENWNVSGMNVMITILTKTTTQTTVSNAAIAIQLISLEIGLSTDSVLPRLVFFLMVRLLFTRRYCFDFSALNQMWSATLVERKDGLTNFKERRMVKKDQNPRVKMTGEKDGVNPILHRHHMLKNGGWQLKRGRIQHQRHLLEKEKDLNG